MRTVYIPCIKKKRHLVHRWFMLWSTLLMIKQIIEYILHTWTSQCMLASPANRNSLLLFGEWHQIANFCFRLFFPWGDTIIGYYFHFTSIFTVILYNLSLFAELIILIYSLPHRLFLFHDFLCAFLTFS